MSLEQSREQQGAETKPSAPALAQFINSDAGTNDRTRWLRLSCINLSRDQENEERKGAEGEDGKKRMRNRVVVEGMKGGWKAWESREGIGREGKGREGLGEEQEG